MSTTTLEWARAEDRQWSARVRLLLSARSTVPDTLTDEVLAEAHQACADSGRPAVELFGEAQAYADEVTRERVPVEARAEADIDGSPVGDRGRDLLLASAGTGVVVSLLALLREGPSLEVTPAALVLLVGVVAGWVGVTWGLAQRRTGLLSRGWWGIGIGNAALGAGALGALTLRDRPAVGDLPTLVPLLACVALAVVATRLPAQADLRDEAAPDESAAQWFDRLGGVLRGRYHLSRRDVAHEVAEAQAFWQDGGAAHPRDEFGSPQVYALRLLEDSSRPRSARSRARGIFYTLMTVLTAALLVGSIADGDALRDVLWRVASVVLFGSLAVHGWRQGRPQVRLSRAAAA